MHCTQQIYVYIHIRFKLHCVRIKIRLTISPLVFQIQFSSGIIMRDIREFMIRSITFVIMVHSEIRSIWRVFPVITIKYFIATVFGLGTRFSARRKAHCLCYAVTLMFLRARFAAGARLSGGDKPRDDYALSFATVERQGASARYDTSLKSWLFPKLNDDRIARPFNSPAFDDS